MITKFIEIKISSLLTNLPEKAQELIEYFAKKK